ncbi:MAG: HAMP domain-containing protein [Anaerolineales bacterium]|nr:HAMP domain-containing protein [Anaerolineales bacterium]
MRPIHWLRTWWSQKLRRRLLLSNIVTVVFFLGLLGALSFRAGQAGVRREVEQVNRKLAAIAAQDISAQYDTTVNNVRLFRRQLEDPAVTLSHQARAMLELRRASPLTYRALYLFDGKGRLLIHLADPLEYLLAIQDITEITSRSPVPLTDGVSTAREAAKSGELFLSTAQIVGADQVPVIYMSLPVVAGGEKLSQILVVEIDLRNVWRRIDAIYVGQTGRAFVVSREGMIIAHPDRSYIGQPIAPELQPVLVGYEGRAEYTDPLGDRVMLASYSPVGKQSGWGIVVEQARAEALAPVNMIASITLGVLAVAVGMAIFVSVLIARGVTQPLQDLAQVTQTIARTGDLSQDVTARGQDEVGQLAATFNQMIASQRQVVEKARRLLEQQIAVNQLALALGETRDINRIYDTIHQHIEAMVDAWAFVVSFYDDGARLIRAGYVMFKGANLDVTGFPPIPLAEPGQGTQSQVIHTGKVLYTPDHRKAMEASRTEYVVEENGTISEGPPPEEDDEDSAKSALYVPMKIEGKAIGVMQLQSRRLDAYSQEDIDLLTAMANVAAVAVQNARLYDAAQQELAERKRAEEELREHRDHLEELVAARTAELNERVAEVEQLYRGMTSLAEDLQVANHNLEATAAKLQEVNQELNDFAYVVSHDLKAPLRAVTQLAGWIAADYADALDEEGQEMVSLLIGRTKRMHNLIQGILEYSRIGRVKEREKEVDLNWLVQDTIEMLGPAEHIQITVEAELPTILGEQVRLEQVFQNLLGNAIKFMDKPAGCVIIDCADEGTHWLFSVADNGPGIEEKYYDRVFQMFQTLAPRDELESTGVGLALVKKIVETWGGSVWLESEVGEGSTFYFTLPKEGGKKNEEH